MNFRSLSISKKLVLSFTLVGLVFVGVAVMVFASLDRSQRAATSVRNSSAMWRDAQQMMASIVEQQNAVRAYTILGKDEFLKTYRENGAKLEDAAGDFEKRAEMREQHVLIDAFLAEVKDWHATRLDRTIALAHDPATRPEAQALAGVKQLGKMRDAMKAIDAFQESHLAVQEKAQARAAMVARLSIAVGGVLAIGIAGVMCWLLGSAIARPIKGMTAAMGRLASGDNAAVVPGQDRSDEIGHMAKAVLVFRDMSVAKAQADAEQADMIGQVADGLGRLAAADLTARLEGLPAAYAKLQADFNAATDALTTALVAVNGCSTSIRDGTGDICQASDDLAQRTEQQAASLEETAAAMDEITGAVRDMATSAAQVDDAMRAAKDDAEQSGAVVERTVAAMGDIERSSNEISEIIAVIDGIAFQTNLLALNAGVEAARAGDAGKGFAVVASEVRALAQRSADAAKDVKVRIKASEEQVAAGVELVGQTGRSLQRIVGRIVDMSELVAGIASTAGHQATGLQHINTAVSEMDGVTQQNAAMVEQSTAAARSLAEEAQELSRQVGRFVLDGGTDRGRNRVHELQDRLAASAGGIAGAQASDGEWRGDRAGMTVFG